MGKAKKENKLPDNCAKAFARSIRSSAQKLNLVAQSIRGLEVSKALTQLKYSKRRIAQDVIKVLQSAIDIDRLLVEEAYVGKALVMKRFRPRARGRGGRIHKPISNLTIVVSEKQEDADGTKS